MVSELPASTPSGPRATPSRIFTSKPPRSVRAVIQARPCDGVSDQGHPTSRGVPDELRRLGCEVNVVENDLDDDVRAGEGRPAIPGSR